MLNRTAKTEREGRTRRAAGIEKYARTDYYRGVGDFVFGLVACYAERFGVRFDGEASAFKRRK